MITGVNIFKKQELTVITTGQQMLKKGKSNNNKKMKFILKDWMFWRKLLEMGKE